MEVYDQSVDLSRLGDIEIVSLTTNMDIDQMETRRLKWNYTPRYNNQRDIYLDRNTITIKPLQIITFRIK